MKLHIALLTADRRSVGCSLAFFVGARLERSLECQRRGGKNGILPLAYAYRSPRADGLALSDARPAAPFSVLVPISASGYYLIAGAPDPAECIPSDANCCALGR